MLLADNHFKELVTVSEETINDAWERRLTGERPPSLTVVIRMSVKEDTQKGFFPEDKKSYYGEVLQYARRGLIVLNEVPDVDCCTKLIRYISEVLGPIKNLIISGHGTGSSIRLSENHKFTTDEKDEDFYPTLRFFRTVAEVMDDSVMKRQIILDACLTATNPRINPLAPASRLSLARIFMNHLKWKDIAFSPEKGKSVFISAIARTRKVEFDVKEYTKGDEYISYTPTSSDMLYQSENGSYKGTDYEGRVHSIARRWRDTQDLSLIYQDLRKLKEDLISEKVPIRNIINNIDRSEERKAEILNFIDGMMNAIDGNITPVFITAEAPRMGDTWTPYTASSTQSTIHLNRSKNGKAGRPFRKRWNDKVRICAGNPPLRDFSSS